MRNTPCFKLPILLAHKRFPCYMVPTVCLANWFWYIGRDTPHSARLKNAHYTLHYCVHKRNFVYPRPHYFVLVALSYVHWDRVYTLSFLQIPLLKVPKNLVHKIGCDHQRVHVIVPRSPSTPSIPDLQFTERHVSYPPNETDSPFAHRLLVFDFHHYLIQSGGLC